MTIEGGKMFREQTGHAPASRFAPLQALLGDQEPDVTTGFQRMAEALGNYDSPVRIQIRLIDDEKVDSWEIEGGSASPAARRREPKNADVVVVLRPDTWVQIAQGRLAPFDALFAGKLRVAGDLELAKRITQHLSDPAVPFVAPC